MAATLARRINRQLQPFGLRLGNLPIWLLGLAIAILWAMPFVWMLSTSLKYAGDVMTVDVEWLPRRITFGNYEKRLPLRARGYYREFTVPTPGSRDRGARRIVTGGKPPAVFYYTADHYKTFRRIER